MGFSFKKSKIFKRLTAGALAVAVTASAVTLAELPINTVSAEQEISYTELLSRLGVASNYSVFANVFTNNSDMEGNICVNNADFSSHAATNSQNNYNIYGENKISVSFYGAENDSTRIALFTKTGSSYTIKSNSIQTLTIAPGENSAVYEYSGTTSASSDRTDYIQGTYYIAEINSSDEPIGTPKEIEINNGVSNDCYIANIHGVNNSLWNRGDIGTNPLRIFLSPETYDNIDFTFNNNNGMIITDLDGSMVQFNNRLNVFKIGTDIAEVDFAANFASLKELSGDLTQCSDSSTVKVLNFDNTINAAGLGDNQLFDLTVGSNEFVVVNIDIDSDTYNSKDSAFVLGFKVNGTVGNWRSIAGHILYNIYDSTAADRVFTGHVKNFEHNMEGTVLMPGGTYYSGANGGNTNGGVIADTVSLEGGEIHKIGFGVNAVFSTTSFGTLPTATAEITKTFSDTTTPDAALLTNTTFGVYSNAACAATDEITTGITQSHSAAGVYSFDGLTPGTYYIKEKATTADYTVSAEVITVTVSAACVVTYVGGSGVGDNTINNEKVLPATYDFAFTKTGGTAGLAGAGFTLYSDEACTSAVTGMTATSTATGAVEFTGLSVGTEYFMKETTTPSGYDVNNTIYKITKATAAAPVTFEYKSLGIWATVIGNTVVNTLTPTPNNIEIIKEYKLDGNVKTDISQTELNATTFELYEVTNKVTGATAATATATAKPIAIGTPVTGYKVTFTAADGIACGKMYKIVETATGDYTAPAVTWFANISTAGVVTYGTTSNGSFAATLPIFTNTKTTPVVTPNDVEIIKEYKLDGNAKTDISQTELNATTFELYEVTNKVTGATAATATATAHPVAVGTPTTGYKVTFTATDGIACGKMYKIVETATGDYTAPAVTWFANISTAGVVTYGTTSNGSFAATLPIFTNTKTTPVVTPNDVEIIKEYKLDGNAKTDISQTELNATTFELYEVTNKVTGATAATATATANPVAVGTPVTGYKVTFTATDGIACGKMYKIVETATGDYTAPAVTWFANISTAGVVTYGTTLNGSFAATLPIFTNTKTTPVVTPNDVEIIKEYKLDGNAKTDISQTELNATTFELYEVTNKVTGATAATATATAKPIAIGTPVTGYKVTFTAADGIACDKMYKIVEATTGDYTAPAVTWFANISTAGVVTYGTTLNGSFAATLPTFINTKTTPLPNTVEIKLIKTYEAEHLNNASLLSGTVFTLYDNASLTANSETQSASPVWDGTQAVVKFNVVRPTVGTKVYYLKETLAPFGYNATRNVYECMVDSIGVVGYRVYGTAGSYDLSFPVCNNEKSIVIIKQYENQHLSTSQILNQTEFTLFGAYDGTTLSGIVASATPKWDSTRGMAVVSFNGVLAPLSGYDMYYLKETKSPSEYSTSATVYECKIDSDGKVSYRVYGSLAAFDETFPICNNLRIYDPVKTTSSTSFPPVPGGSTTTTTITTPNGGNTTTTTAPNGDNTTTTTTPNGGNTTSTTTPNGGNTTTTTAPNGDDTTTSTTTNGDGKITTTSYDEPIDDDYDDDIDDDYDDDYDDDIDDDSDDVSDDDSDDDSEIFDHDGGSSTGTGSGDDNPLTGVGLVSSLAIIVLTTSGTIAALTRKRKK